MDMQTMLSMRRRAHWHQAKGHLMAMMEYYQSPEKPDYPGRDYNQSHYAEVSALIEKFVNDVESWL